MIKNQDEPFPIHNMKGLKDSGSSIVYLRDGMKFTIRTSCDCKQVYNLCQTQHRLCLAVVSPVRSSVDEDLNPLEHRSKSIVPLFHWQLGRTIDWQIIFQCTITHYWEIGMIYFGSSKARNWYLSKNSNQKRWGHTLGKIREVLYLSTLPKESELPLSAETSAESFWASKSFICRSACSLSHWLMPMMMSSMVPVVPKKTRGAKDFFFMPTGIATRAPATEKNQVPRALHGHETVFTGRSKQIRIIV